MNTVSPNIHTELLIKWFKKRIRTQALEEGTSDFKSHVSYYTFPLMLQNAVGNDVYYHYPTKSLF
jgi:hypothetical protein